MNKITSFCINHDVLGKGMYVSRVDGDIITYDLRMIVPNNKENVYLDNDGLHTFEHLFATYVRNSKYSDDVVYAGPMGCRTGFYFLTRDSIRKDDAIKLVQAAVAFIKDYNGDIPGAQEAKECGNYLDHNIEKAKTYAKDFSIVIKNWQVEDMEYLQGE